MDLEWLDIGGDAWHRHEIKPFGKLIGLQYKGQRPDQLALSYEDLDELLLEKNKDILISYLCHIKGILRHGSR